MRSGDGTTRSPWWGMSVIALCIFQRSRSISGALSRIVRLQKSDLRAGSFSTAHMIASVAVIRPTPQECLLAARVART